MSGTVLITGASRGIGEELAKLFAQDKYNLVLVARNEVQLHQLKLTLEKKFQIQVHYLVEDLTQENAYLNILNQLKKLSVQIDVLVNNAGIGDQALFATEDPQKISAMINLNIKFLTEITRNLLPAMLQRKQGKILNVASTAAFQPGPMMAVYYATKAYVLSFSEALRFELRHSGISVTTLCPGPTETMFHQLAQGTASYLARGRIGMLKPEIVAKIGYRALNKNQDIIVAGWFNYFLTLLIPFTPRSLTLWIVNKLHSHH